jgi:hypothetical protein
MIEFHAGSGPDSQAVGVALEEGFFDYRVVPGGSPPLIVDQGNRIGGAGNILAHLAQRVGWPFAEALPWLVWSGDLKALDQALASSPFILGEFSIADMAVWPRVAPERAALVAHPNVERWLTQMGRRAAAGRGLGVVSGVTSADRPAADRLR